MLKAVILRWSRLGPLDRVALVSSLVVAGLVIAVIAFGDRVGVRIEEAYPVGLATETSLVSFRFSESMDRSSVADHFTSDPEIEGEISWRRERMVFQPRGKLKPGTEYRLVIGRGAQGRSGREVLEDYEITFLVSNSVLLFLRPDEDGIANVWAVDPADPETATQVTHSPGGVGEFEPSPDGKKVAFTERDEVSGNLGLRLFDLDTGALSTLTDSQQADAYNPTWHPDGTIVAFERVERFSDTAERVPIPLIWAVDLFTNPPTERRLIANRELPGYAPKYSRDGRRIAWGADSPESSGPGVFVYDFIAAEFDFHDTLMNTQHAFSNDASRLIFPVAESPSGSVESSLSIVDVETGETATVDLHHEPAVDRHLEWSPDDRTIALVRRYRDSRALPGHQQYLLDTESGELDPIMDSAVHDTNSVSWSPSGQHLAVWRTLRWDEDGAVLDDPVDEVWVYDIATGQSRLVVANAASPKWLP